MPHVKLPKDLFGNERFQHLSVEAKVLYAFMADRTSLSRKNGSRWILPNGEVYIIFTHEETMRLLSCGHDKASKVACELVNVGLVKRFRQGLGKPNLLVVDTFLVD